MQWAARSRPQWRRRPRSRARISFVPTESVEAASSRRSSSGESPANAPNPSPPGNSTAARSRSTTASAVPRETPAAAYVPPATTASVRRGAAGTRSDRGRAAAEPLAVQLGPSLRAARDEADDGLPDRDPAVEDVEAERVPQRRRLQLGLVRPHLQLLEAHCLLLREQLLDPVARRVALEPVAGVRRDERPAAGM